MTIERQTTLKEEISLEGVGLHTGKQVKLTFKPAKENTGFVFVRSDLEGSPEVEALAKYVKDTERGTTIEKNGVQINTSEHVLSALVGCDVDNAIIEMNSSEPPIMDGSAKFFVEAIQKSGIDYQEHPRKIFELNEVVSYSDGNGSEIVAIPYDGYKITSMVDFGTKILGTQNATLESMEQYTEEISKARTFSFLHELETLLQHGLIKGGDLNNAIIYVDKEISKDTEEKLKEVFNKETVSIKPNGILDNLTLHYPNEAARHKLLDIIGDLALIGRRIKAKIIATKPGHYINTQFAKKMQKHIAAEEKNKVPYYNPTIPPVMDIHQITDMLPHRYPFLLVDKIIDLTDNYVVGVKNVTTTENFFQGHFPGAPIMPGVLQIEAMAQVGGILALSTVEDPENYLTYFMKADNVKFKQKVIPGDVLIFKMELLTPIRRGICHMQGYGYVGEKLVVEGELMAQISKVK